MSELTMRFFGLEGPASQVGTTLVDLMFAAGQGGGVMWVVETVEESTAAARRVLADIETYGEPFFGHYRSPVDVTRKLEQSAKKNFELAYLAVSYAVSRECPQMRSVLVRLEDWVRQQPPFVAQQTERFLSEFRAYFEIASS